MAALTSHCFLTLLLLLIVDFSVSLTPAPINSQRLISKSARTHPFTRDLDIHALHEHECQTNINRRYLIERSSKVLTALLTGSLLSLPQLARAKCTDIESCREEGERKIEADLKNNPIIKLSNGVRYRVLQPGSLSGPKVKEGSSIDLAYSISTTSGQYMYSKGFGFEKVNFGGKLEPDLGLDSMRVVLGQHDVPIGIEMALLGMGKGERRRVELPPGVGFETSNWSPEPTTRRGKTQIEQYKKKLAGFGSQPPFPAETVWDIEVFGIRN
jgi:FKBP-type peptidyl-prolyl cis-trans isomerase